MLYVGLRGWKCDCKTGGVYIVVGILCIGVKNWTHGFVFIGGGDVYVGATYVGGGTVGVLLIYFGFVLLVKPSKKLFMFWLVYIMFFIHITIMRVSMC